MEIVELNKDYANELFLIDKSAFKNCWTADEFFVELNTQNRIYFGVKENKKLIAYIGLNVVFDECDIIRIAVLKEEQHKGVAKYLLNQVINFLKQNNVFKIMLEVSDRNNSAINLYKSVGFKQIFLREKYYEDMSNALIFELEL